MLQMAFQLCTFVGARWAPSYKRGRSKPCRTQKHAIEMSASEFSQPQSITQKEPAPKYHTKGCSRSSVDSPAARTLVFAAFEPSSSCEFRASIARTPFCAILWRTLRSAKVRKPKCAKERKKAQKGANGRNRAPLHNNCKQPGLKPPGVGTTNCSFE